jgi:hypothetical protein
MSELPAAFAIREKQVLRVYAIAGKSVVSGLHWERLESIKNVWTAVRDRGTRQGFDVACDYNQSTIPQVGFGVSKRGAQHGAIALAPLLAAAVGEDGIVCVRLPDGDYAMVAVRDGLIMVGSDLSGPADLVQHEFVLRIHQLADFGHAFKRILAPAEIYQGAELPDDGGVFEPLRLKKGKGLAKARRDLCVIYALTRAADPRSGKTLKWGIATALVGVICMGGYWSYYTRQQELHAQQLREAAERMRQLVANQPPPQSPKPWVTQPTAQAVVVSCSTELSKLPVAIGGWMLDTASCGSGRLEASYQREGNATVADLLGALQTSLQIVPNLDTNGDKAGFTVGFKAPATSGENLIPTDDATTSFLSHFQRLDVSAPLTLVPPPIAPPGQEPLPIPPWKTFTWAAQGSPITAIDTSSSRSLLLSGLDIPGLRIDSIGLVRTDSAPYLSWTVAGHLYAN